MVDMKTNIIKFLAALLVAASFPVLASAQYFVSGGIAYGVLSETEHTVEVTTKYNGYYHGNINIPPTVTYGGITYDVVSLGALAFYGSTLTSVTIPTSVTRIKSQCFLYSNGPTSVTVPASVAEIGMMAFAANNLNIINVAEANPWYQSIDGILFSKDTATIVECPVARSGLIILPQNTVRIASWAFANCQSISGIVLHEGLTDIGYGAFMTATRLDNVIIPTSVTHIGENLFSGCTALNNLTLAEGNAHYYLDGLMLYTIGRDTLLSAHKSADTLLFPATLRAVGGFSNNRNIRYISLSDSTTTILENAFENSTLVSINMPSRMELIGEYAFYGCEFLTHVGMPASLGTLDRGCFSYCTGLTSIEIPDGLAVIPMEAFYGSSLSHITWGDSVVVIDSFAFGGCAFEELLLPASLRVLRDGAFNGYYDGTIRRVVFSAQVDTLETETFYGQPLTTVVLRNSVPPIATTYEGMYGPLDDADVDSIFIPCGSLSAYLADSYWSQFADKYYEDCSDIDDVTEGVVFFYPNPANNRLTIIGVNGCDYFELVNMLGKPVVSREIVGGTADIDVSGLAHGAYFVRLHTPRGIVIRKLVLQ